MDILSKTDDEVYEIAKPIWNNLVKSSNMKDYGGFTRDFSTQMLFGANEVELGKQWANNKIITNLKETFEPFGCLRRGVKPKNPRSMISPRVHFNLATSKIIAALDSKQAMV